MTGKIILLAITAMLGGSAAAADQERVVQFDELDANQDGYLTQQELRSIPNLDRYWQTLDINQDGKIEQSEFAQFEIIKRNPKAAPEENQNM